MPSAFEADFLDRIAVAQACSREVVTLPADRRLADARRWLTSGHADADHQGHPIVDGDGAVVGVLTRRDLLGGADDGDATLAALLQRPMLCIGEGHSLREAADLMVEAGIGRLVVVDEADPRRMTGS